MPDWLELDLAEALRPTAAPRGLWQLVEPVGQVVNLRRVVNPPASEARLSAPSRNASVATDVPEGTVSRSSRPKAPPANSHANPTRTAWPIAAILTLMIAAGTLWLVAKGEEPSPAPLARSAAVTFPSRDAATSTRTPEHCLLCHTSL
jgi:hypothetical protein